MRPETDDRYKVTAAGFLFCVDCGSLVMEGYRSEHDRLHPRVSCNQMGCGMYHFEGHAWTEMFQTRATPNEH